MASSVAWVKKKSEKKIVSAAERQTPKAPRGLYFIVDIFIFVNIVQQCTLPLRILVLIISDEPSLFNLQRNKSTATKLDNNNQILDIMHRWITTTEPLNNKNQAWYTTSAFINFGFSVWLNNFFVQSIRRLCNQLNYISHKSSHHTFLEKNHRNVYRHTVQLKMIHNCNQLVCVCL